MSDSSAKLLRMLEPAVRPGPASSRPSPAKPDASGQPFEGKSFDELLREVGSSPAPTHDHAAADAPNPEGEPKRTDPLAPLRNVENASLARLLGEQHGPPNDS